MPPKERFPVLRTLLRPKKEVKPKVKKRPVEVPPELWVTYYPRKRRPE